MAVVPSSLIDPETLPEPGEVWQPTALLRPNGTTPITVRTAWRTSVSRALSGAETRRALRDRPAREIVYQAEGWRDSEALHVRQLLADHTRAGTLLPLWSDASVLTGSVSAASVTVPCDTTSRRLQVGARVALVRRGSPYLRLDDGYTLAVIDSLAADAITLTAVAGTSYAAGDLVVPIIEAALEADTGLRHHSADVATATIDGGEIPGPAALEPIAAEQTWPGSYATQDGLPILHLAGADGAVDVQVASIAEQHRVGQTLLPTRAEGRPLTGWRLQARFLSRAAAWPLLQLFDAARGRCHGFYFVPAVRDFEPTAITTTTITVPAIGAERAWDDRPHIAVLKYDGTILVRAVSGVVRGAGSDVVTVPSLGAITLAEVKAVTIAYRARFASDEIVERWVSHSVVEIEASLQELQDDSDQTIADLVVQSSGNPATTAAGGCIAAIPPLDNLFGWIDASDDDSWTVRTISSVDYLLGLNKAEASTAYQAGVRANLPITDGNAHSRSLLTLNGKKVVGMLQAGSSLTRNLAPDSSLGPWSKFLPGGFSVYCVGKLDGFGVSTSSVAAFCAHQTSSLQNYMAASNSGVDSFRYRTSGTVISETPAAWDTNWHLFHLYSPTAGAEFYRDSVLRVSTPDLVVNWSSSHGPQICWCSGGSGAFVAEWLMYDIPIVPGSAQDLEVRSYLSSKWGI